MKTKTISWGQLFILFGAVCLFLFAFTQRVSFERKPEIKPVEGFVFSSSTIVGYTGTDEVLDIPNGYSYGPTTNYSGSITFNNRSEAFNFLQEHYTTGAAGYYDFYNQIYQQTYPWQYTYSIDKPSFIEGDDFLITEIASSAFEDNEHIKKVILPDKLESIGNFAFQDCYNLKEIEFGDSLTFIGDSAFWNCGFEKLTLPDTIETIYPYAFFRNKNLVEVTLPKDLKNITLGTFNACEKLEKVIILSEYDIEAWHTSAYQTFSNCTSLKSIYVKQSKLEYYKNTHPWSLYATKYKILN